jgi:hypothetical protein
MSKKKKQGLIEAKIGSAIDKVADTAIDKVKEKIDEKAPDFIGDAVGTALDNFKDTALEKAKTEIKDVAVKQTKRIAGKVIRRSVTFAALTGCAVLLFKNKDKIIGLVKGITG